MRIRTAVGAFVAGAGLVLGTLVTGAPTAEAACTIPISGPTRWVIDGTDTNYRYTARASCSPYDWSVDANVYGPNSSYRDYDFFYAYKGSSSGTIGVYDWTKAGRYVFGSKTADAYNSNYRPIHVAGVPTKAIRAKYASRAKINGSRSGSKVRLSGSIKRYCEYCVRYDEGYTNRRGTVLLQRKQSANGSWRTFKTLRNVNGTWSYTAKVGQKYYFRAVVGENTTNWSATSNRVRR